jgi:subtilase family serine protease
MMAVSRSRRLRVAGVAVLVSVGAVVLVGTAGGADARTPDWVPIQSRAVCGQVSARHARCAAVQVLNPEAIAIDAATRPNRRPTTTTRATTTSSTMTTTTQPGSSSCTTAHAGFTPCDVQAAYALPAASAGAGQTVAIVDAYNAPNAEADLGVYRAAYGLGACTTANGCFRKVNQTGGTKYPRANVGWSEESSLDLDMVSAACPKCHILLVEANSNNLGDLLTAENEAVVLGANVISNSWASKEFSTETSYDSYFHHNIPITASTGDSGYGVGWPAASSYVTAVGGTSLTRDASARGWSETAWSGTGSGCSAYEIKPAWQTDTGCPRRTVGDVSAVADPSTGVAVYDSYGVAGWLVFGGTSVASPIVAAVYALAANGATPTNVYAHASSLFDVTSGTNGSCGGSYLCNAGPGYDGPTGLGSPNGTGGF